MADLGKTLLFFGLVLAALGLVLVLAGRTNLPIGRLPGDLVCRDKHTVIYFPLATSILLSVVLSLIFYVIAKIRH